MTAPAFIQSASAPSVSFPPPTFAMAGFAGASAGSTILVYILQEAAANRTWTVEDNQGNVYTQRESESGGSFITCELWSSEDIIGGDLSVTVTQNTGSQSYRIVVIEIGPSTYEQSTSFANVSGTTQYAAPVAGIDTGPDVFVASGFAFEATIAGGTPKGGWVETFEGDRTYVQHIESDGSLLGERGQITIAEATREANAAIGSWVAVSTGTETTGTSNGQSTVNGEGQSLAEGAGSVAGVSVVNGQGGALAEGNGLSFGVSTVNGTGASLFEAVGIVAGQSIVSGEGQSLKETIGTVAGVSVVNGEGQLIKETTGTSAGVAIVLGVSSGFKSWWTDTNNLVT